MVWACVGLALLGSNAPKEVISALFCVFLYSLLNKELSLITNTTLKKDQQCRVQKFIYSLSLHCCNEDSLVKGSNSKS